MVYLKFRTKYQMHHAGDYAYEYESTDIESYFTDSDGIIKTLNKIGKRIFKITRYDYNLSPHTGTSRYLEITVKTSIKNKIKAIALIQSDKVTDTSDFEWRLYKVIGLK
jgi:hypothetical protein